NHRNLLLSRINYHRRSEFTERISHRLLVAHSAWTGGSVYTGQAALPHKNIQNSNAIMIATTFKA
ncbi:MAG: hypothetical protein MR407_01510, partial [Roseburia sp.]|nr:hypothetical protein [Roseburia sp.]